MVWKKVLVKRRAVNQSVCLVMHGSTPTVTIPPPGHTPGDLPFFLHWASFSSPPSCTVPQEDRNIYYIYNIEGKITEC